MTATNQPLPIGAAEPCAINESSNSPGQNATASPDSSEAAPSVRRRLPDERYSLTHHFSVAGQEGYLTVGLYENGRPGELFIRMAKEGSTISGLMDAFATAVSLALQYGVPLEVMCSKFTHMRFEPSGWSGHPKLGYAKSIVDYVFRWLELKFLLSEQGELFQLLSNAPESIRGADSGEALASVAGLTDARACTTCGCLMSSAGSCYTCAACGATTSGCS